MIISVIIHYMIKSSKIMIMEVGMKRRRVLNLLFSCILGLSLLAGTLPAAKVCAAEDDLVVHLKFDGDLNDSSGNGNHAECTYGNITFEDGIHGQSAFFNGKSYLEIKDNDSLDLEQLTISLWAYKTDNNGLKDFIPYVVKERDEDIWAPAWELYEHWSNTPGLWLHNSSYDDELDQFFLSGRPVDIRKWYLLTATFDGTEARIYENDTLIKKENVRGGMQATLGNLYIGIKNGELFFKGNMDDLKIYNRVLSAQEIASRYKSGLAESPELLTQKNRLVAHYKFDGDYKDSSGLGNHAELVTGNIKFINGINGMAAEFKNRAYLEVADNTSLDFDEGFALTAWIKVYNDDDRMMLINKTRVSTTSNSNDYPYQVLVTHDYYDFNYVPFDYQPGTLYSRYGFEDATNKWVHVGLTFDTKEVRWYYNGKMVKKEETREYFGNDLAHSIGDLMIGSDGDLFLDGAIDELKLYNYALSAKEIEADYKNKDSLSVSKKNQDAMKGIKAKGTITLTPYRKYIETGKSVKLNSGVTYKSSNKKVFTVSKSGKITAVKKGKAKLTITHGGISKTYTVNVK